MYIYILYVNVLYEIVRKCTYNIKSEFFQLFQKILLMIMGHAFAYKHYKKNPHLSSTTTNLLRSSSAIANL